ncbi:MAG: hypothetical protein JW934_08615 [Anaerolineae bacterium]|nr:hypothetical protein [Anaerolineae bacterium]
MQELSDHDNFQPPKSLNDLKSPKPQRRWGVLVVATLVIIIIIVVPLIIGLGQKLKWWANLSLLKVSTEPEQAVYIAGRSESGILMTIDNRGVREVALVISDTWHIENLSQGITYQAEPVISPKGDRVVFIGGEDSAREIKIVPRKGTVYTIVKDQDVKEKGNGDIPDLHICTEHGLKWSPNGKLLAFFACKENISVLMIREVDTQELKMIPNTRNESERTRTFAWLDDKRIVFSEQASPKADVVFVIDIDGNNKTQILFSP